jgi:acyl-coenzyme A thioesterase PaaI-like protein
MAQSPAARLLAWWRRLHGIPGGRWLFAQILAIGIPYTGTIRPKVLVVEPGYARVELKDRRRVRNHLQSVHALALANVGELTTGLAMTATVPPETRSILKALHVDFVKKARGTVVAECNCFVPVVVQAVDYDVSSVITDAGGDVVATVTATWRLSPPL